MSRPEPRVPVSISHPPSGIQSVPLNPALDSAGRNVVRFRRLRTQAVGFSVAASLGTGVAMIPQVVSEPAVTAPFLALPMTVPALLLLTGGATTRSVRWGYRLAVATFLVALAVAALWLMHPRTHARITMPISLVVPPLILALLAHRLVRARRALTIKSFF